MPKHPSRTDRKRRNAIWEAIRKIPIPIWVAIVAGIFGIVTKVINPDLIDRILVRPTSIPTPACISEAQVLVTFHILENDQVVAELAPGETAFLMPDTKYYFEPEIKSVSKNVLPDLECEWTNTGIATEGKLLHDAGCGRVDYKSGHTDLEDAVMMKLHQPSCPALVPYALFILPKP